MFQHITRTGTLTGLQPRIYVSCHKDDLELHLKSVCADIFAAQENCAVFYDDNPDRSFDEGELEDFLNKYDRDPTALRYEDKLAVFLSSVMIIERSAFYNCMNLEKIYMPDSVASLDSWVFEGCANLTVYCPEDSYTWEYCEATGIPHEAWDAF